MSWYTWLWGMCNIVQAVWCRSLQSYKSHGNCFQHKTVQLTDIWKEHPLAHRYLRLHLPYHFRSNLYSCPKFMANALHDFFLVHLFDDVPLLQFFCMSDVNLILSMICSSSLSLWLCENQTSLVKLTHWGTIFDIF